MPKELFETSSDLIKSLHLPVFLLVQNARGAFVLCKYNRPCQTELFDGAENIAEKEVTHLLPNAQGHLLQQQLEASSESDRPLNFEFSVKRTNYNKHFRVYCQPLCNGESKFQLATAVDITESRATANESSKMALLVNEMESYMAIAAGNLEHPLEHLSTLSQELKNNFKDLGDGKLQLLDQVEELSKKTLIMVRKVLDHSRSINPSVRVTPGYDLNLLCGEVLETLDPHQRHQLQPVTLMVEGETRAMRVIIAALMQNAIEHNASQDITFSASVLKNTEKNQCTVTLHIDGIGFFDMDTSAPSSEKKSSDTTMNMIELHKYIMGLGGDLSLTASADPSPSCAAILTLPSSVINCVKKLENSSRML